TNSDPLLGWRVPWVLFVVACCCKRGLAPALAYLEGSVSVARSWRIQTVLEFCSGSVLVGGLLFFSGLWSLVWFESSRIVVSLAWIMSQRKYFGALSGPLLTIAEWKREILPFQWKVAVSG